MMSPRLLPASLVVAALLLSGCAAAADADHSPSTHAAHMDGMDGMDGLAMHKMHDTEGPSDAARMICSDETRDAVRRTLGLHHTPAPTSAWAKRDRVFSCDYPVGGGRLELSVQDASRREAGKAYFDGVRAAASGARPLRGVASFGLPSFQTAEGTVAFLKDGKTLQVDASGVPAGTLPKGFSRQEVAYGVASAVVACWSE